MENLSDNQFIRMKAFFTNTDTTNHHHHRANIADVQAGKSVKHKRFQGCWIIKSVRRLHKYWTRLGGKRFCLVKSVKLDSVWPYRIVASLGVSWVLLEQCKYKRGREKRWDVSAVAYEWQLTHWGRVETWHDGDPNWKSFFARTFVCAWFWHSLKIQGGFWIRRERGGQRGEKVMSKAKGY